MDIHVWTTMDRNGLPWTVVHGRPFGRWWTLVDIGGHIIGHVRPWTFVDIHVRGRQNGRRNGRQNVPLWTSVHRKQYIGEIEARLSK